MAKLFLPAVNFPCGLRPVVLGLHSSRPISGGSGDERMLYLTLLLEKLTALIDTE